MDRSLGFTLNNWWSYYISDLLGNPYWLWLSFIVFGLLIFWSAMYMTRILTTVSQRVRIGSAIIGGVVLSIVTSIPETVTAFYSGTSGSGEAIGLGISNEIGANLLTFAVISVGEILFWRRVSQATVNKSNFILIFIATCSTLLILLSVVIQPLGEFTIPGLEVGVTTLFGMVVWLCYFAYSIFWSKDHIEEGHRHYDHLGTFTLLTLFFITLVFFGFVSLTEANIADLMKKPEGYNLGSGIAGGLILPLVTVLPEISSFILLTKAGLYNVSIASIAGSHVFNLALGFVIDVTYRDAGAYAWIWESGNSGARQDIIILSGVMVFLSLLAAVNWRWRRQIVLFAIINNIRIASQRISKKPSTLGVDSEEYTELKREMLVVASQKNQVFFERRITQKVRISYWVIPGIMIFTYFAVTISLSLLL